jgi:hypothetical protein
MKIIFTTNNKFWSKVFRYLTKTPVTHVAFVFNFQDTFLTIDCSTDGGRLMTFEKFSSINFPVFEINLDCSLDLEVDLFKSAVFLVGKKYDMPAYIYGIWRGLLFTLFGIKAPFKNKLSKPNLYCCTEIFLPIDDILKREFNITFSKMDLAIKTPYEIYLFLKDSLCFISEQEK